MPYVKGVTKRRQILPTPEEARNSDVTAGPGLAYIRWRARAQTTPYSRKRTCAVQLGMFAWAGDIGTIVGMVVERHRDKNKRGHAAAMRPSKWLTRTSMGLVNCCW
jgi:hypothetical protein